MSIRLLDEAVRGTLRSGVALTSVAHCVGELVENSIDAGAKCIAVRLDLTKYKIQVIDNGQGVAKKDMDLIGQRYATSKCRTLQDLEGGLCLLGYRGEALASMIEFSGTVEVSSRHFLSQETYSKLFYHGRPNPVTRFSSGRASVGTTVTLHDFFYNVPVRRKTISESLETENVRHVLQGLALAHPSVSFSLRNDALGDCVMQVKKTNSLLGTFSSLFGASKASSMREVASKVGRFGIRGALSVDSHYNKALQFVFVNGRPVKKTRLHLCVNHILANSLICRGGLYRQNTTSGIGRWNSLKWPSKDSAVQDSLLGSRRSSDRHGMFVIMVECPRTECDICLEPSKTLVEFKDWDAILNLLTEAVVGFLKRHSLTLGLESMETDDVVVQEREVEGSPIKPASSNSSSSNNNISNSSSGGGGDGRISDSGVGHQESREPVDLNRIGESHIIAGHLDTSQEDFDVPKGSSGTSSGEPVEMLESQNSQALSLRSSDHKGDCNWKERVEIPRRLLASCHGDSVRSPLHSRSLSSKLSCLLQRVGSCEEREKKALQDSGDFTEACGMDSMDEELADEADVAKEVEGMKQRHLFSSKITNDNGTALSGSSSMISQQLFTSNLRNDGATENILPACEHQVRYHPPTFLPSTAGHRAAHLIAEKPSLNKATELLNSAKDGQRSNGRCSFVGKDSEVGLSLPTDLLLQKISTSKDSTDWRSSDLISSVRQGSLGALASESAEHPDGVERRDCSSSSTAASMSVDDPQFIPGKVSHETDPDHAQGFHRDNVSSLWREVKDPSTGKKTFIHERTGKTSAVGPVEPRGVSSTAAVASHFGKVPSDRDLQLPVVATARSIPEPAPSSSYGSRPLSAAPHLSFDFEHFVPSSKRLRVGGIWAANTDMPLRACTVASSHDNQEEGRIGRGEGWNKDFSSSGRVVDRTSSWCGELVVSEAGPLGSGLARLPGNRTDGNSLLSGFTTSTQHGECTETGLEREADEESVAIPSVAESLEEEVATNSMEWNRNGITEARHAVERSSDREREGEQEMWEKGAFERLLESWTNPAFLAGQQEVTRVGSGSSTQIKVHNIIHGYKFTKDMFSSIKVLGQVDKKFIACKADSGGRGEGNLVVLFDQHAAHERVRLEALLADLYESDEAGARGSKVRSSVVQPPLPVHLSPAQVNLTRQFRRQFEELGISLVYGEDGVVGVASVPLVLVQRDASERRRGRPSVALDLVQEMITKHSELLKATCGGSQVLPASLTNILNSQACRSAVKFGDTLSLEECQGLIESLSTCKLPFQCAHGRPSLVPILDLDILKKRYSYKEESGRLSRKLAERYSERVT